MTADRPKKSRGQPSVGNKGRERPGLELDRVGEEAEDTPRAESALEQTAVDIGAGLAKLLNRVERRWTTVQGQRQAVVASLRAIRDKANALLAEAGDIELPLPAILKRGAPKRVKAKKRARSLKPKGAPRSSKGRG